MNQSAAITINDVEIAKTKLRRMRRSLLKWLDFRKITDELARGMRTTKNPHASQIANEQLKSRHATEVPLARKLHALLSTIEPDAPLPDPMNPDAAVTMAMFAVTGQVPPASDGSSKGGMSGFGGAAHPWMWPALIVGGLLLAVTTAIHSAADVARDREEKACIMAGACTDYGFWLKVAAVVGIGWFAWEKMGLKHKVKF